MREYIPIKILTFIAVTLLCSYSLCDASSKKTNVPEFVIVFPCTDESVKRLCLTKDVPIGINVILLGKNSKTCSTRTLNFVFGLDSYDSQVPVTSIDSQKCGDPKQYILAYFGNNNNDNIEYVYQKLVPDKDPQRIELIHSRLQTYKELKSLRKFYQNCLAEKPVLYAPLPNSDVRIAHYPTSNSPERNGVLFFIHADGSPKMLEGDGGIDAMFILNDREFVLYSRGCWQGCGDIGTALIEITDSGYRVVFLDGFFAD